MDSGWRKTREQFKAPKEWLEAHKDWQVTMTPEMRHKDGLKRAGLAIVCLVLVGIFWKQVLGLVMIPVLILAWILGTALSRKSYHRRW